MNKGHAFTPNLARYHALMDVVRTRMTSRAFRPEIAVPREHIEMVLEAARHAPSGANAQPWHYVVVTDTEVKRKIADDPGTYDLIVVDAFSSDTVPAHLLTREAMAVYAAKLAPGGIVAMHVSNRHMELASVVAGIAAANGLVSRTNPDDTETSDDDEYKFTSTVVAVARADEDFGALATTRKWTKTEPDPRQWVWTDDYTNVVGSIIRQMKGE